MTKNEPFKIHFNVLGKNIWDYHKNQANCFQSRVVVWGVSDI